MVVDIVNCLYADNLYTIYKYAEAVVYEDADQRFGITSNFSLIQRISCSSTAASNLNMCSIQATCATQCNTLFTKFYGIKCLGKLQIKQIVSKNIG